MKKGLSTFLAGLSTGLLIAFSILVCVFSRKKGEAIKIKVKGRNNQVNLFKKLRRKREK